MLLLVLGLVATGARAAGGGVAPGAPGQKPDWLPADRHGFGTSTTRASKVWLTLEGGELSEVYYPRLDTPSFRDRVASGTACWGRVDTALAAGEPGLGCAMKKVAT